MNKIAENLYAVVMAGGSGTRFWPLSRKDNPKQVLSITGGRSMIQHTVQRVDGLVSSERVLIVTNQEQLGVIKEQLPDLKEANYLIEPVPKNTAPCIGLAAGYVNRADPEGVMLVLPADHRIRDIERFRQIVLSGLELLEKHDGLVTMGIPPTRPETGYGYIQFEDSDKSLPKGIHRVKAFAEKPNLATADRFIRSGDFYWNSGIFMWRASRILKEMEEHLPDRYHLLNMINEAANRADAKSVLEKKFKLIKPISIDYGIMEVSRSPIFMLNGDFGWSDVGSWDEVYRIKEKDSDENVIDGEVVSIDAKNNYVLSKDKLTAIIGLKDLLIVNTENATLICPRDRAQDVKGIVDLLEKENKKRYI